MYTHASMPERVSVAVAGASGYAGMTLVHLLARHPGVQLVQLTSRSFAGQPYSSVFPLLDLRGEFAPQPDPTGVEVIFSCLPHNVGASLAAAWLAAGVRVIDMSAAFRLKGVGANGLQLTFVPHLVPMTRGILATCYFDLKGSLDELQGAYAEFYAGQPFTKVVPQTPATKLASHSNLCLVNVSAQGGKAVV